MSREKTIKIRQQKLKEAVLEQLKHTPTIESACQKSQISRATVYRWIGDSKKFAKQINNALTEGRLFISDIAEAQIFSLIGDKKMEAIKFYLTHNNERYSNKLELSGTVTTKDEPLTSEQKKLIKEALKLSLKIYADRNK